jgi:hypothetical protein
MTFESRRANALQLMEATGIRRGNYEPPMLRALWKLGMPVPPPHFLPFWKVMLFAAVWFGGAWGAIMWFTNWSRQGIPLVYAVVIAALAGVAFGLTVALYYAYGRRKHRLPAWTSLDRPAN